MPSKKKIKIKRHKEKEKTEQVRAVPVKPKEKPAVIEEQGFEIEEHARHVTPVLPTGKGQEQEAGLEDFLKGVEVKPEKKGKEQVKYSPSLYGETKGYMAGKEQEKEWEETQREEIRHLVRPRDRTIREVAELAPRPRARETPFIHEERFERVVKYDIETKKPARVHEFEKDLKEKEKKLKKYEAIY